MTKTSICRQYRVDTALTLSLIFSRDLAREKKFSAVRRFFFALDAIASCCYCCRCLCCENILCAQIYRTDLNSYMQFHHFNSFSLVAEVFFSSTYRSLPRFIYQFIVFISKNLFDVVVVFFPLHFSLTFRKISQQQKNNIAQNEFNTIICFLSQWHCNVALKDSRKENYFCSQIFPLCE